MANYILKHKSIHKMYGESDKDHHDRIRKMMGKFKDEDNQEETENKNKTQEEEYNKIIQKKISELYLG